MSEMPHAETRVLETGEVSITVVYCDGYRLIEWCGLWRALWLTFKLTMRGIEVRECSERNR